MTIRTIVHTPGNGTRYAIVVGRIPGPYGESFVALPDFGVAATMSPYPAEWGYIAEKLHLSEPDAREVFAALRADNEAEQELWADDEPEDEGIIVPKLMDLLNETPPWGN